VKVALLGACFGAVCVAAGCGTSSSRDAAGDGSTPTTSVTTPTNTADPARAEINTSWVLLFGAQATKSAPPEDLYAVFRRKQTDDEAKIAPELVTDFSCSMGLPVRDRDLKLGKPIADKARILLRGVGSGKDNLVAVATTGDSVSVAVFPSGGGTCTSPSDNGLIIAGDDQGNLYGMVDDKVRSVDVIADGRTHRAKLGENGFAAALPSGADHHLNKLVLHRADGSTAELPLG
jgi:hypothetical protein